MNGILSASVGLVVVAIWMVWAELQQKMYWFCVYCIEVALYVDLDWPLQCGVPEPYNFFSNLGWLEVCITH